MPAFLGMYVALFLGVLEDMHVHSTFSDGKNTVAENLARATEVGLSRFTCVDHVRRDTDWLSTFVPHVREASREVPLDVLVGVEAKFLDQTGTLDMPDDLHGVDRIYAADHQIPMGDRCVRPRDVREAIHHGALSKAEVIRACVDATVGAMRRYPDVVVAHLFSVLPKARISEDDVPLAWIEELASVAKETGSRIEIDERWRCPSPRTVALFARMGVPVLLSTDAHRREDIGQYEYALRALEQAKALSIAPSHLAAQTGGR